MGTVWDRLQNKHSFHLSKPHCNTQIRSFTALTMRIPESWKVTLKSFSSYSYTRHPTPPPSPPITVHNTPAGQYPQEGPQPGKLGVIFYYFSVALCIMGVLTMARCTVIQESARPDVLLLGLALIAGGLLSLNIANYIYNKEHKAVVDYLKLKVGEYRQEHRRNIQGIPPEQEIV